MKTRILLIILSLCVTTLEASAAETVDLTTAIRLAQERNPEITVARQQVAEAQAMLAQTAAAWHPMLGVEAGYSYMDYPLYTFGAILNQEAFTPSIDFNDTPEADDLHLALKAGYRLYDGGGRGARRDAARAGVEAALAGEQTAHRQLAFYATQAWLHVYQAGQHGTAAEAMRDALTRHLQTARSHLQQGTLLEADVLEVQLRVQEAEEQVLRVANQRALAAASLANILGSREAVDISQGLPELAAPDSAGERPELRLAQARIAAAERGIDIERAGHLPKVDAFGTVAYHDGFELDQGDGRIAWMAGVRVEMKLWDGELTSNRIAAARSRMLAAEGARRRAELQIELQQTEARLTRDNAAQRCEVIEQALALADKHVELTTARFDEGLATVTQMVDAETARTAARIRLTNAKADLLLATASLRHALGLDIVDHDNK